MFIVYTQMYAWYWDRSLVFSDEMNIHFFLEEMSLFQEITCKYLLLLFITKISQYINQK